MYFLKETGNYRLQVATSNQTQMGSHSAQNSATPGFVFFNIPLIFVSFRYYCSLIQTMYNYKSLLFASFAFLSCY